MNYYTSDTHFGHENAIQYCNRPFKNREHADQSMVENWNATVKSDSDIVYHGGDVALGCSPDYAKEIVSQLNGRIVLIRGSHDNNKAFNAIIDRFDKIFRISDVRLIRIPAGDNKSFAKGIIPIFISHYNHRVWPLSHYNSWHLFGHSHGRLNGMDLGKAYDIGVDCNNFTPISELQIKDIMNKLPDNFNYIPEEKRHKKIDKGSCVCIAEPRGDNGLEGFTKDSNYHFELINQGGGKRSFYCIFPASDTNYFETCGPNTFKKYFKAINN